MCRLKRDTKHSELVNIVERELGTLENIIQIQRVDSIRKYRGGPKVKIPDRWQTQRCLPLTVCDGMSGVQVIYVWTTKPGAIARILRRQLTRGRIMVVA
jgi:hypothetical protein